jgi:hypothetical protein
MIRHTFDFDSYLPCSCATLLMLLANLVVPLESYPLVFDYESALGNCYFCSARTQLLCFLGRFHVNLEQHLLSMSGQSDSAQIINLCQRPTLILKVFPTNLLVLQKTS